MVSEPLQIGTVFETGYGKYLLIKHDKASWICIYIDTKGNWTNPTRVATKTWMSLEAHGSSYTRKSPL